MEQPKELWSIKDIERTAVVLFLIALGISLFIEPSFAVISGLVSGTLISLINFRILTRFVSRLLQSEGKASFLSLQFLLKLVVLVALVWFLIAKVKVEPLTFLIGFSTVVFGIFYGGFIPDKKNLRRRKLNA